MKFCPKDRHPNPDDAEFCGNCGAPMRAAKKLAPAATPKGRGKGGSVRRPPAADVPLVGSPPATAPALVRVLPDGREGGTYWLRKEPLTIGRVESDVSFPDDGHLSKGHCQARLDGEKAVLRDRKSRNGTFLRRDGPVRLDDGAEVLLGQTLLRWTQVKGETPKGTIRYGQGATGPGWIVAVSTPGKPAGAPVLVTAALAIGRAGDGIAIDDPFVGPGHLRVKLDDGVPVVEDGGSANGTYHRVAPETDLLLDPGARFRCGSQLFLYKLADR